MFRWYKNAVQCYAYLTDVEDDDVDESGDPGAAFDCARWFSRGWTLQELIAPRILTFYSVGWVRLGTRSELRGRVSSASGIEEAFLRGPQGLERASVAKKMSWAARRRSTRTEDVAYCLLGLFDVNMPLLYGEGSKAFRRLQEEIMRTRPSDHSLYAWGRVVPQAEVLSEVKGAHDLCNDNVVSWDGERAERSPLFGLLAESPCDFEFSGRFTPSSSAKRFYHNPASFATLPTPLDQGIRLALPIVPGTFWTAHHWKHHPVVQVCKATYVLLFCTSEAADERNLQVVIPLLKWHYGSYARTRDIVVGSVLGPEDSRLLDKWSRGLYVAPAPLTSLESGDMVIRRCFYGPRDAPYILSYSAPGLDESERGRVLKIENGAWGSFWAAVYNAGENRRVVVVLGRNAGREARLGSFRLTVALFRSFRLHQEPELRWVAWSEFENVLRKATTVYERDMEAPKDQFLLDKTGWPIVCVTVERVDIGQPGQDGSFDAIDIRVGEIIGPDVHGL